MLSRLPFTSQAQTWGPAPPTPVADRLVVDATNVASVTIDRRRARVSCKARIDVVSDGPVKVRLGGCKKKPRKHNRDDD